MKDLERLIHDAWQDGSLNHLSVHPSWADRHKRVIFSATYTNVRTNKQYVVEDEDPVQALCEALRCRAQYETRKTPAVQRNRERPRL